MKKNTIKSMSFEEAENKAINYTRLDSTGTKVFDKLDNKEMKMVLILNTMQINDFITAIEHKIDNTKITEDRSDLLLGYKLGLESALDLWYNAKHYLDNENKKEEK
jgi:hypothetical protein